MNRMNRMNRMLKIITLTLLVLINLAPAELPAQTERSPGTIITDLKTQGAAEPLAVEDRNPLFSWIMVSSATGQCQSAYQIIVRNEISDEIVWNSGKVSSGISGDIRYHGRTLEPETPYRWDLTVWDAKGKSNSRSSRFETGIMNPRIDGWNGAEWIGSNQLLLDAASAYLFEINTDFQIIPGSKAMSLVFGASDFRLNDRFQNIENVEGENYIRLELDISGVGTEKGAVLNIYRAGYGKDDSPGTPYRVISTEKYPETNLNNIITPENKNSIHNISISVDAGNIVLQIDKQTVQTTAPVAVQGGPGAPSGGGMGQFRGRPSGSILTITNYGTGGNYNTFPNLNSVGFASNPGDEVIFSNYRILNKGQSSPDNNIVFDADNGATYSMFRGLPGVAINDNERTINVKNNTGETLIGYADPSHGSLTMLRTQFNTALGKSVARAKMYVTAMGGYEVYINGERMGDDWFSPGASQFRETLCYYAYDVTGMIRNGANSLGAMLNQGWYTGYMTFTPSNFNFFGDTEALLAKLVITYTDGTKEIVVTGPETWKLYKNGPVEYGSFFQGERYNALKEVGISAGNNVNGWTTTDYDDSVWQKAEIVRQREWVNFDIVARYDKPVRVVEVLTAGRVMDVHSDDGHTYTYDMGVNMVGVPSVTIPAGWLRKGDVVIFRYGEQIYPGFSGDEQEYIDLYGYSGEGRGIAGRILPETYRAALATDFYTAADGREVVIQPRSTWRG